MSVAVQRRDIFVSYSHRDVEWLEQLQVHLKPLFPAGGISIWADTDLPPGSLWFDEIDQALQRSAAAVLLLSPYFFASEFIMEVEWPRLRDAARDRDLKIMLIAVRASAFQETEIGAYQGLMDLAKPLDRLSAAEQGAQLVTIARKLRDITRGAAAPDKTKSKQDQPLTPLRTIETSMANIGPCLFDAQGHLWVSNGQQVKVFQIDQEQPIQRWQLSDRRWKGYAPEIWADHLVMSDWDGNLYQFNNANRDGCFHAAQHDSLPFHLMAKSPAGHLLAAAWDGSLHRWNADGSPAGAPVAMAALPTLLVPLSDGQVAVADQANDLHVLDAAGNVTWSWNIGEPVQAVWPFADGKRQALAVIATRRVLKFNTGERQPQEQSIPDRIVAHSRRPAEGDEWVVIASERGRIDWLSMSPFSLIRDNTIHVDFDIRQISAVPVQDMASRHIPIAVGLTDRGQLFLVQEHSVRRYEEPQGVEELFLAPSGRFLFLRSGSRVSVYRSPAVASTRCLVEIAELNGTLAVKGYKKLVVKLKNSGTVPIYHLKAELHADGIIENSRNTRALTLPVRSGDAIELEFAVLARVSGDAVPLVLRLELADEGGPPLSVEELRFSVESR